MKQRLQRLMSLTFLMILVLGLSMSACQAGAKADQASSKADLSEQEIKAVITTALKERAPRELANRIANSSHGTKVALMKSNQIRLDSIELFEIVRKGKYEQRVSSFPAYLPVTVKIKGEWALLEIRTDVIKDKVQLWEQFEFQISKDDYGTWKAEFVEH